MLSNQEVKLLRSKIPFCSKNPIYLNSAVNGLKSRDVIEKMKEGVILESELYPNNLHIQINEELESFKSKVSQLIGCSAESIFFTSGINDGLRVIFEHLHIGSSDVILTSSQRFSPNGPFILVGIPMTNSGYINLIEIERLIKLKPPKLILLEHISKVSGKIQPIYEVTQICVKYGIKVAIDIELSIGQLPFSINQITCDYVIASCGKYLGGPQSTGFIYIADIRKISQLNFYSQNLENISLALLSGCNVVLKQTLKIGIAPIKKRIDYLIKYFFAKKECVITYDYSFRLIFLELKNIEIYQLVAILEDHDIFISIIKNDKLLIILSFNYYNTTQEIDSLFKILSKNDLLL